MLRSLFYILFICLLLISGIQLNAQITIESNNFIQLNISSSVSEAGNNIENELSTFSDEIKMTINIFPQNIDNTIYNTWRIEVSRNDVEWHNDLSLYTRVTGTGRSDYNNIPTNGEFYKKIETYNVLFFNGTGWINSIPIQLKLTGLSVMLPAKTYSTEIIFTLIDD